MGALANQRSYAWELVRHPVHVVFAGCVLPAIVFFTWSTYVVAAVACAEVGFVWLVHRMPSFRRMIDERNRAIEAESAARVRSEVLGRLTEPHRTELFHLEALADSIRARVTPSGTSSAADDCLGLDRLLAAYAGGAIACATGRASLAATDRDAIAMEIAALERKADSARTETLRAVAVERLRVARMRAARWDRSRDDLEEMEEQLTLIADVVRLTHENAMAPLRSPSFADALGRALASIPDGERTLTEIVELLATDPSPEPRVLSLGRRALAATTTTTS